MRSVGQRWNDSPPRLATVDGDEHRHSTFDRSMSCHVPDLNVTFSGALSDGHITGITTEPLPRRRSG